MLSSQRLGLPVRSAARLTPARPAVQRLIGHRAGRKTSTQITCESNRGDGGNHRKSKKGDMFDGSQRRRGRPAHLRSPDDSPNRDGNRDRLAGLLTERSVATLLTYLMETNMNLHYWLVDTYKASPIPRVGSWEDVSGDTFLRKLLSMPIQEARVQTGLDAMYDTVVPCLVDPRSIAQRIMDIRVQLSKEFIQDLAGIAEENNTLLRETLVRSLESTFSATVTAKTNGGSLHPEVLNSPSISTSASGPGVAATPPVKSAISEKAAPKLETSSIKIQEEANSNTPAVPGSTTTAATASPAAASTQMAIPAPVTPQAAVAPAAVEVNVPSEPISSALQVPQAEQHAPTDKDAVAALPVTSTPVATPAADAMVVAPTAAAVDMAASVAAPVADSSNGAQPSGPAAVTTPPAATPDVAPSSAAPPPPPASPQTDA